LNSTSIAVLTQQLSQSEEKLMEEETRQAKQRDAYNTCLRKIEDSF